MSEQSSNRTSTTSSYNGASGGTSSDTGTSQTTTNTGGGSTESSGLPEDWEELRRDKIELEAAQFGSSQSSVKPTRLLFDLCSSCARVFGVSN
ncbi:uncharacterized protein L199_005341 [Kwoniella botswanensis]|uniref:uncharacterized protein n=1 Tax=Kwoniella botswanensis TaxID=1268659 RepID=UPI00315DF834